MDRAGAACSTVCAVHCAFTAAIPSALAALGLGALMNPTFEWVFTIVAILIATIALVVGWRKHRVIWIGLVFVIGIVGLGVSRILESAEIHGVGPLVGVLSGIALVVGHVASIRVYRSRNEAQ